jgi:hypothetical protein
LHKHTTANIRQKQISKFILYDFLKVCESDMGNVFPISLADHKAPRPNIRTKLSELLKHFLEKSESTILLSSLLKIIGSVSQINIF